MLTTIDDESGEVIISSNSAECRFALGSPEGFAAVSKAWLRAGWDAKHVYSFTWMGRPIIQLPEDILRTQELIYALKPDVIIETGVAHGGSLVFYASLFKLMGKGHVIGVDLEIRPHNREAIESHELFPFISLIEGDAVSDATVQKVRHLVKDAKSVLVILDSNHSYEHVFRELELYCEFVTIGSYIVATDGIMEQVVGAPRTQHDWSWNNPRRAALAFAECEANFRLTEPPWLFNEGTVCGRVSYWPDAFLQRIS